MAYFGKEFKFEKEENYEDLIKSLALTEEQANGFRAYRPSQKIEKNGDGYKLVLAHGGENKEIVFKKDEVVAESHMGGSVKSNTKYTVDGDTFIQEQNFGDLVLTTKREFSANQLKVTVTNTKWDGVAYRWYTAA